MSLSQQISAAGPFDLSCNTFFPTLPAPTARPKTLGLEHSKFAKFFLVQFSSPLPRNDFHTSSSISNKDLELSSPLSDYDLGLSSRISDCDLQLGFPLSATELPSSSLVLGSYFHGILPFSSNKHKPAPVALGMPNAVAFQCEAVREKDAVQETRFGKIHYSSIGLI